MKTRTLYLLMLWAPLALPAALWAAVGLLLLTVPEWYRSYGNVAPEWISGIVTILLYSPLVAGIPYVFFALWATGWLLEQTQERMAWLLWRAPVIFLPVFAVYFVLKELVVVAWSGLGVQSVTSWLLGAAGAVTLFAGFVLLVGYGYVVATVAVRGLLQRFGVLEPSRSRVSEAI